MSQHRLLLLDIGVPFKAVDVDHAPLAGSGRKGLFVARYRVRFAFDQ